MATGKKGYFFTIDAFLAIGVIIIGLVILASVRSYTPYDVQTLYLSRDFANDLGTVKMGDLNTPIVQYLIRNGIISSPENTVIEQIGSFYYTGENNVSSYILQNITKGLVPDKYGYDISIEDRLLYNTSVRPVNPNMLLSTSRIAYGIINQSEMWGPYKVQIRVWQVSW